MEKVIMCASIITAIILCLVGIIKLPFRSLKSKHPKSYRAIFCTLSLVLAIGLPFIAEVYILNGAIKSVEFIVLIFTTIAGVFGLYTSYEGLGLKNLVKIIIEKICQIADNYTDARLTKIINKVGIDKLNELSIKLTEKQKSEEVKEITPTEVITTESNNTPTI